jgi:hypothetical protein
MEMTTVVETAMVKAKTEMTTVVETAMVKTTVAKIMVVSINMSTHAQVRVAVGKMVQTILSSMTRDIGKLTTLMGRKAICSISLDMA